MKNNEKFTGVSVFYVDEGIDSGPIITQEKIEIGNKTLEELIISTKKMGIDSIIKSVNKIINNNVEIIQNNDNEKTYYSFPKHNDVKEFLKNKKKFF